MPFKPPNFAGEFNDLCGLLADSRPVVDPSSRWNFGLSVGKSRGNSDRLQSHAGCLFITWLHVKLSCERLESVLDNLQLSRAILNFNHYLLSIARSPRVAALPIDVDVGSRLIDINHQRPGLRLKAWADG